MSALGIALEILGSDFTGAAFGSVVAKLGALDAAGAGSSAALDAMGLSMAQLEAATLAAGAAFVGFGALTALAVDAGAQLQMSGTMASIAISDGAQHVQELQDAIVNLANSSQYKIADVDQAFRILGGLGFNTATILNGLGQQAIILGQALGVQAADGAQLLGQAMYLFGNQGLTAAQAADILTGAYYNNMMSVSGLTEFLGMAGGTADALGVSMQSLLTFGDMLTPMFGSASSAGASLAYMMRNLAHPATSKVADEIQQLGLQIYDAQGNFVGLQSIMDQLFTKMQGMTQQQRMDVIGTLFNVRSGRAAMDLMAQTQSSFDSTYQRIYDRLGQVGQAQRDSTAINATAEGSWKRLTTTVNDFFAKSGEGINTVLTPLYDALNNLVSVAQQNPRITQFFAAFLVGGTIIAGLSVVAIGLVAAFALFGPVMTVAALVFGGIVMTATAVGGAFAVLTAQGEMFSGWLSFLNPVVDGVRAAFSWLWGALQSNLGTWQMLAPVGNILLEVLKGLLVVIGILVVGPLLVLGLLILGLVDAFTFVVNGIEQTITHLGDFVRIAVWTGQLLHDIFTGQWQHIHGDVVQIDLAMAKDVEDISKDMQKKLKTTTKQTTQDAIDAANAKKVGVLNAQADEASKLAAGYQEEATYYLNTAKGMKDGAMKTLYEQNAATAQAQADAQNNLATTLRNEAGDVQTQTATMKNDAVTNATQQAQAVVAQMASQNQLSMAQVRGLTQGAKADFQDMRNDVNTSVSGMSGDVVGSLQQLAGSASYWGNDLAIQLAAGIRGGAGQVDLAVNQLAYRVAAQLQHSTPKEGPLAGDDQWGGHIVDNLVNGMLGRLGSLGSAVSQVAGTIAGTITPPTLAGQQAGYAVPSSGLPQGVNGAGQVIIPIYLGEDLVAEYGANLTTGQLTMNGMGRMYR